MKKVVRMTTAVAMVGLSSIASAHEPLWGESPQTFAFGIWHPEVRFGFQNERMLLQGSHRIENLLNQSRSRFDTMVGMQYAPTTSLNVRVEIPFASVNSAGQLNGRMQSRSVSGLGDIMLSAKSRFRQRFGQDWKEHMAYGVGIQLPTGEHTGRDFDGSLLQPSEQPGSGKWGYMINYSYGFERLRDTVWFSIMNMGDFGGTGAKGNMTTVDINYGYWVKRAYCPQELGVVFSAGPHLETMGRDRLSTGLDANSGYSLGAVQFSVIATKGQAQARFGALFPTYQRANGTQLRPNLLVRAGIETLF